MSGERRSDRAALGPAPPPSAAPSVAQGLARAAVGIAVVTVLARLVGFGRVDVLARTVGQTCLGDTYQTANTVPNILFEIVAGGALASLVVPVLAGPAARGDTARVGKTTSALLCWAVLLLVPLALLGALLGPRIIGVLTGPGQHGCSRAAEVAVGARMLVVFMPQVVLYAVGIVLTGVLQAHRRFLGPALAPLLSSIVVIAAYLLYAAQAGGPRELAALPRIQELTLSIGTTLGVVALSLSLLVPLRGLGLPLRPTLSFPPGVARTVRRLALAGAAGLVAQQISVAVVLRLAHGAPEGSVVVYTLAWTVFLLPWAVLAVPIATSAFPTLAAHADAADDAAYAALAAATLRAVLLISLAAAAVVVATATPMARVLVLGARGRPSVDALALGLVAFAPGLVGYGLLALLGRALYARGDGRSPAVATVTGWLVVIGTDVGFAALLPPADRVAALGLGNTAGMTVAGVLLLRALGRVTEGRGLAGLARAGGSALAGVLVATALGVGLARGLGASSAAVSLGQTVLVGVVTVAVFAAVLLVLDGGDLRALVRRSAGGWRRAGD